MYTVQILLVPASVFQESKRLLEPVITPILLANDPIRVCSSFIIHIPFGGLYDYIGLVTEKSASGPDPSLDVSQAGVFERPAPHLVV
jgi:hypothetical protein